ncbi:MAG: FadR family transcriptional regulator [Gammaproteobacteria bacterium]|nr:FadR family transcriptional regulator [Gammaproteobacteria bacterium]
MNNIGFEPVRRHDLSKQIADQIRQAIIEGTLKADDRLPTEEDLAQRFDVSRPTIREALKRLAAQNLIRTRRGPTGGSFITNPSMLELSDTLTGLTTLLVGMERFSTQEINQARQELELICCRLAATQCTREDLLQLGQELQVQQDPALSPEAFCASDVRFHRAIANATGNHMLAFIMHTVIEALQPVANMLASRFQERQVIVDQHQRLYEALEQRDAQAAEKVIIEQIAYLSSRHEQAQARRAAREDGDH